MKIILASSSLWRKKVLDSLGIKYAVVESGLNEESVKKTAKTPKELVLKLAQLKAEKVIEQLRGQYKNYLLIAADSIAYLGTEENWQIFDKPKDKDKARVMLKSLRGKKHNFITGLLVVNEKGKSQSVVCLSEVTFKNFSDADLEKFLAGGGWRGKAGGYDVTHKQLIAGYTGSYSNICGLPTEKLIPMLKEFGVKLD